MSTLAKIQKIGKKLKFKVRVKRRCPICGRARGYYRKFDLCRLCLRDLALKGQLPGVVKSSW
ncbi:MAG: type Z 30S ribosomal protein S14 [Deltaproteobacteria bacterium]|nr:type Z 30S ribosomal protein S14 [Deltaproteobacteria bacterium]